MARGQTIKLLVTGGACLGLAGCIGSGPVAVAPPPPEPPSARTGAIVSPDLEALLLACLAKRPADRPASAHALRDRLRACTRAGAWTNARAAEWWAQHRTRLQARHQQNRKLPSGALTVTRFAD